MRDRTAGTTEKASLTDGEAAGNGDSGAPTISADGTRVAFYSSATNLAGTDTNLRTDVAWRGRDEHGPFATTAAFVARQYQDFVGQAPTAAEASASAARRTGGIDSACSAIDDWAHGTFDDRRGPVTRLYWAFFKRLPDLGGSTYWVAKNTAGMNLNSIANYFAQSSEFQNTYGDATDAAYVALVYANVLDRAPDAAGTACWVAQLGGGLPRGQMMVGFSESNEGKRLRRGVVDAVLLHLGMLHRLPTADEVDAIVAQLAADGGTPTELVVLDLLTSGAYAAGL